MMRVRPMTTKEQLKSAKDQLSDARERERKLQEECKMYRALLERTLAVMENDNLSSDEIATDVRCTLIDYSYRYNDETGDYRLVDRENR